MWESLMELWDKVRLCSKIIYLYESSLSIRKAPRYGACRGCG